VALKAVGVEVHVQRVAIVAEPLGHGVIRYWFIGWGHLVLRRLEKHGLKCLSDGFLVYVNRAAVARRPDCSCLIALVSSEFVPFARLEFIETSLSIGTGSFDLFLGFRVEDSAVFLDNKLFVLLSLNT